MIRMELSDTATGSEPGEKLQQCGRRSGGHGLRYEPAGPQESTEGLSSVQVTTDCNELIKDPNIDAVASRPRYLHTLNLRKKSWKRGECFHRETLYYTCKERGTD